MKTLANVISIFFVSALFSCTSARYATKQYDDDVYYTPSDDVYSQTTSPSDKPSTEDYTSSGENNSSQASAPNQPNNSDGNITNNYYGDYYEYDDDDYYDYAYSSRIRRFYNPIYTYGYYDPWYTNVYWYDYNPAYYGNSIYLGYSWWYPSPWSWNIGWNSFSGWNVGWNFGWGYSPYWGCGNGYYGMSYYHPYGYGNAYSHGYNNGYWNGYNDGLYASNNYYYNSYDANSYYYGNRSSTSSNGGRNNRSLAENYQSSVGSEKAFNSKYADISKSSGSRIERNGISNISSESNGGSRVNPGKENPTISPERGKLNDINNYSTPKGLHQNGGNINNSSPTKNTVTNEPSEKSGGIKNGYPGENISKNKTDGNMQPDRNKSNIYIPKETPNENKPSHDKYGSPGKLNNEKGDLPGNRKNGEHKYVPEKNENNRGGNLNFNSPKDNSPRNNSNSGYNSSPSHGGGHIGSGKTNSPNFNGSGSSVGGGRGSSSTPAPSGGKSKR